MHGGTSSISLTIDIRSDARFRFVLLHVDSFHETATAVDERSVGMPRLHETAYPRFKTTITEQECHEIYAPTPEGLAFVDAQTYSATAKVGLLVLLKTFQGCVAIF